MSLSLHLLPKYLLAMKDSPREAKDKVCRTGIYLVWWASATARMDEQCQVQEGSLLL